MDALSHRRVLRPTERDAGSNLVAAHLGGGVRWRGRRDVWRLIRAAAWRGRGAWNYRARSERSASYSRAPSRQPDMSSTKRKRAPDRVARRSLLTWNDRNDHNDHPCDQRYLPFSTRSITFALISFRRYLVTVGSERSIFCPASLASERVKYSVSGRAASKRAKILPMP